MVWIIQAMVWTRSDQSIPEGVQFIIVIQPTSTASVPVPEALGKGAVECERKYKTLPSTHFSCSQETTHAHIQGGPCAVRIGVKYNSYED